MGDAVSGGQGNQARAGSAVHMCASLYSKYHLSVMAPWTTDKSWCMELFHLIPVDNPECLYYSLFPIHHPVPTPSGAYKPQINSWKPQNTKIHLLSQARSTGRQLLHIDHAEQ